MNLPILLASLLLMGWSGLVWVGCDGLTRNRVETLVKTQSMLLGEQADAISYNLHRSLAFLHALPIHLPITMK
ncbi:MAG: hypothetical protein WCP34_10830 [Pseudomonadota bacterium]